MATEKAGTGSKECFIPTLKTKKKKEKKKTQKKKK